MDEDRIEDLLDQLTGNKPFQTKPATGFRPEQLESYPLMRIGPRLYSTPIESVAPSSDGGDYIFVDSEEMEAYSPRDKPHPEDFKEVSMIYEIPGESGTFQGSGKMIYRDLDPYFEEYRDVFPELQTGEFPDVVLFTGRSNELMRKKGRKEIAKNEAIVHLLQ